METLSVDNGKRSEGLLLEELKRFGVLLKENEAFKASEHELERLLQDMKSKQQNTATTSQNLFVDFYESMISDFINKLTLATVFFSRVIPGLHYFGRLITTTIRRDPSNK